MCAKTRKLKSKRTKKSKGSLFTILLVLVITSILAAAIAYFFYNIGNTNSNLPAKTPVGTTKTVSDNNNRTKSILDGTWVSTADGRMLEIHGTIFSLELPSVSEHKITKGSIHINGDIVTIMYSGTKDICAESPGTYSFVINRGGVRFSVKHDNCPGRKQIFSTTWEKF